MTAEQREEAQKGIDCLHRYLAGEATVYDLLRETTDYQRFLTTRALVGEDTLAAWLELLNEVIRVDPTGRDGMVYLTQHGAFTTADILEYGGTVTRLADGQWRISWPGPEAATPTERRPIRSWD